MLFVVTWVSNISLFQRLISACIKHWSRWPRVACILGYSVFSWVYSEIIGYHRWRCHDGSHWFLPLYWCYFTRGCWWDLMRMGRVCLRYRWQPVLGDMGHCPMQCYESCMLVISRAVWCPRCHTQIGSNNCVTIFTPMRICPSRSMT